MGGTRGKQKKRKNVPAMTTPLIPHASTRLSPISTSSHPTLRTMHFLVQSRTSTTAVAHALTAMIGPSVSQPTKSGARSTVPCVDTGPRCACVVVFVFVEEFHDSECGAKNTVRGGTGIVCGAAMALRAGMLRVESWRRGDGFHGMMTPAVDKYVRSSFFV